MNFSLKIISIFYILIVVEISNFQINGINNSTLDQFHNKMNRTQRLKKEVKTTQKKTNQSSDARIFWGNIFSNSKNNYTNRKTLFILPNGGNTYSSQYDKGNLKNVLTNRETNFRLPIHRSYDTSYRINYNSSPNYRIKAKKFPFKWLLSIPILLFGSICYICGCKKKNNAQTNEYESNAQNQDNLVNNEIPGGGGTVIQMPVHQNQRDI